MLGLQRGVQGVARLGISHLSAAAMTAARVVALERR